MKLTIAERDDFLQIAQQTYNLWSAGLTQADYRYLLWSTHYQIWAKNDNNRLVYRHNNKAVASCKVVKLPLLFKGKHYKLLGLGAVYTAPDWRGQGLATRLVKSSIARAKQEDIAAILLFSAIDTEFYAACGFKILGNLDFELDPRLYSFNEPQYANGLELIPEKNISIDIRSAETLCSLDRAEKIKSGFAKFHFSSFLPWLSEEELLQLNRCHSNWLARQPYGIIRDNNYFAFQLAKFLFFSTYSSKSKATLSLTLAKNRNQISGYAITECSGTGMRILELIGDDISRAYLWQSLIKQAQTMNLIRMSGFESCINDFIPGNKLDATLINSNPEVKASHMQCYERLWSQPMFLPLAKPLESLSDYHPCPLLEFDY